MFSHIPILTCILKLFFFKPNNKPNLRKRTILLPFVVEFIISKVKFITTNL